MKSNLLLNWTVFLTHVLCREVHLCASLWGPISVLALQSDDILERHFASPHFGLFWGQPSNQKHIKQNVFLYMKNQNFRTLKDLWSTVWVTNIKINITLSFQIWQDYKCDMVHFHFPYGYSKIGPSQRWDKTVLQNMLLNGSFYHTATQHVACLGSAQFGVQIPTNF